MALSFLALLLAFSPAFANNSGKVGVTTTGCSCHGSTPSSTTTATFSSTTTDVAPGGSLLLQLVVATSSTTRNAAGLNVAATGGTLVAGSNTRVSSSEITHSSRQSMTAGSVTFNFSWTAPTTPGTYTIRGVGNAVNSNSASSGDAWNYASSLSVRVCGDADSDGVTDCAGDCDDTDNTVYPGAAEICDSQDNDCDSLVDDADPGRSGGSTWYRDQDSDLYGNPSLSSVACVVPSGYIGNSLDCDDTNSAINPVASEVCNGSDDDCDSLIDDSDSDRVGGSVWYRDNDFDVYGDPATSVLACIAPLYYVSNDDDCNDSNPGIHPSASEQCNLVDDDCDGLTDDADTGVLGRSTFYYDQDGDGYGLTSATTLACQAPSTYVALGGDCAQTNPAVHPGASEICNLTDDDCDGLTDDADPGRTGGTTWYRDADGDGFGGLSPTVESCVLPVGYSELNVDCNDSNSDINPAEPEVCDGLDQDCDGSIDEGAPGAATYFLDNDSDGYGDPATGIFACSAPSGRTFVGGDCDDSRNDVNPGAVELCDVLDVDEDCDGLSDDDDTLPSGTTAYYVDSDEDGWGGDVLGDYCSPPVGSSEFGGDCDDADPLFHPSAAESCTDPVDYNCDGSVTYADADGDGFAACMDCDDTNEFVFPDAVESCNDLDDDCDGVVDGPESVDAATFYLDLDEDDWGLDSATVVDCEAPDGYTDRGFDCDDASRSINPDAEETWYDGIDQDCDENDDDQDGDGHSLSQDCDDLDPEVFEDCGETDSGSDGGDGADGSDGADGADGTSDGAGDSGGSNSETPPKKGCATVGVASGSDSGLLSGLLASLLLALPVFKARRRRDDEISAR